MRVQLDKVTKRFGNVTALDEVSVEVEQGEFFFLLGPSGCGKTTLLRVLAGFEQPDSGRVLFDEQDVCELPPERRGAALVFQNYALWPHLTVRENIAFGLDVRKIDLHEKDKRVKEVLSLVRMQGFEQRRPAQLSGGQQQRVALARALVVRPQLVLLDEPLSNLDARLRMQMRTELREIIKALGHTAVYVTHDQKEALAMADQCAILDKGRIEQVGTPETLYEEPENRFVAQFLGETNFFPARVVSHKEKGLYEVQLEKAERVWLGHAKQDLEPGQQIVCSVRPESLHIGSVPETSVNRLEGDLVSSMYLGEVTQYHVAVSAAEEDSIRVLELHAVAKAPGPLVCWVGPRDTVLLTSDKG